jgi:hypothetical protein
LWVYDPGGNFIRNHHCNLFISNQLLYLDGELSLFLLFNVSPKLDSDLGTVSQELPQIVNALLSLNG